jgi:hypothetical protein
VAVLAPTAPISILKFAWYVLKDSTSMQENALNVLEIAGLAIKMIEPFVFLVLLTTFFQEQPAMAANHLA